MTWKKWPLILLVVGVASFRADACEPILPIAKLLGGVPTASSLTNSVGWLLVAVALKSVVFAFLEKRLLWRKGVSYMVLANIISTIPGILVAWLTSSVGGVIIALPIVGALGVMVEKRLISQYGPKRKYRWINGGNIVLAFILFYFISLVMYGVAFSQLERANFSTYWIVKFMFVSLIATTGILISTVLEESVVALLARKSHGSNAFFSSVWRANYITLGFILLVAAIQILPRRLADPHFLMSWLQSISSYFVAWSANIKL